MKPVVVDDLDRGDPPTLGATTDRCRRRCGRRRMVTATWGAVTDGRGQPIGRLRVGTPAVEEVHRGPSRRSWREIGVRVVDPAVEYARETREGCRGDRVGLGRPLICFCPNVWTHVGSRCRPRSPLRRSCAWTGRGRRMPPPGVPSGEPRRFEVAPTDWDAPPSGCRGRRRGTDAVSRCARLPADCGQSAHDPVHAGVGDGPLRILQHEVVGTGVDDVDHRHAGRGTGCQVGCGRDGLLRPGAATGGAPPAVRTARPEASPAAARRRPETVRVKDASLLMGWMPTTGVPTLSVAPQLSAQP